jgi:hypothetical protein
MSANSKSNALREATTCCASDGKETIGDEIANETVDAIQPLRTTTKRQREEQMYQLAEIFAAIFETLQEEYEPAAATIERAA